MNAGAWMRGNLTTQGYRLSDAERRQLAVGLRFSTGLCLTLVVVVGTLLAAGAATAALVLGGMLVAACALVTNDQPLPALRDVCLARAPARR